MKNFLAFAFAFVSTTATVFAQTTNFALENESGAGKVSAFTITELDNGGEATFQMWLKPTAWSSAKLVGQDNFSVELSADQQILVKAGGSTATITAGDLLNKWSQLTVTVQQGTVKAFINNEEVAVSGSLPGTFDASEVSFSEKGCVIADGFKGQIDEIRVWSKALEQDDFFWNNTLNKFNPNYDALVAYWKCDQDQCDNLVDYKLAHHGEFDNVTRVAVTDNSVMKYRVVTGYTNLMRFTDRPKINRDMFLMTNDLILLSAKVQQDGSLFPEYPDNSATPTNVNYLADFEGRTGVMDFQGKGAMMSAEDGRTPFDPTERFGYGATAKASFSTWMYIDTWVEGAELFSNYLDDDNCMVIKLGSEADKELIVDLCGTTATLKDQLETGKWQFVSVYLKPMQGTLDGRFFNPVSVGIGAYNESGEFESKIHDKIGTRTIELGGKDMTITAVPAFQGSTLTIGKDFDGKLDEVMVWGSDRSGAIGSDATKPYEWNIGNWDNIFLNAYWKGDDPENLGKDSQSYLGMIDFIRNYYKNHRGFKIRMGIIYPDGTKWINGVLNKKENVDNLIRDAKVLLSQCDGLDVDLEWMYSTNDWNVYNNVVGRLITEVMADAPEKTFSCSLHAVSFSGFSRELLDDVDYFTFQLYGPNKETYYWDYYENAYKNFSNWGFPKDKILLSYGVLLVNNGEEGYKDLFEKYGMNDDNFDPDLNSWSCNGTMKYYNGVNQVKRKQRFIIDNDCRGTMYFDMGNDQRVDDYKSLIRAQNDIIASNVDTLITEVNMIPTGIETVKSDADNGLFVIGREPSAGLIRVVLKDDSERALLEMYSVEGRVVKQLALTEMVTSVPVGDIQAGVYLVKVVQGGRSHTVKLVIN